jgi:hypothetical protein
LIVVCCLSGELQILKINGRTKSFDHVYKIILVNKPTDKQGQEIVKSGVGNSKVVKPQKSQLNGLSKLGDGRIIVMSNQGFSIWQVSGLTGTSDTSNTNGITLVQQSKQTLVPLESISQVLECSANTVVVSTMSCMYYKVNLKNG